MTKDAVYLATGLDAPDGLRAGTELPPWVPSASNLFVVFNGGFVRSRGRYVSNKGTLFCNLGVQYCTTRSTGARCCSTRVASRR